MNEQNPFSPPATELGSHLPDPDRAAMLRLRWTLVLLLPGAILNAVVWDIKLVHDTPFVWLMRAGNVLLFLFGVIAIWFFALPALRFVVSIIHRLRGRSTFDRWNDCLLESFRRLPLWAAPGCVLWLIWSSVFFAQIDEPGFGLTTFLLASAAHLLAACWYLPLVIRLIQIERAARVARD